MRPLLNGTCDRCGVELMRFISYVCCEKCVFVYRTLFHLYRKYIKIYTLKFDIIYSKQILHGLRNFLYESERVHRIHLRNYQLRKIHIITNYFVAMVITCVGTSSLGYFSTLSPLWYIIRNQNWLWSLRGQCPIWVWDLNWYATSILCFRSIDDSAETSLAPLFCSENNTLSLRLYGERELSAVVLLTGLLI